MRRKELMQLQVFDVDGDRGVVMIRQGKGKKDRIVPIGDRASKWIDRYVQEVRAGEDSPGGDAARDVMFLTGLGEPFTPNQLTKLVADYVTGANIGKKGSCHLFRHTMATLMLENGSDIRFVQAMLGHARLDTTMIYTKVSIRKLKEIHTATHARNLEAARQGVPDQIVVIVFAKLTLYGFRAYKVPFPELLATLEKCVPNRIPIVVFAE